MNIQPSKLDQAQFAFNSGNISEAYKLCLKCKKKYKHEPAFWALMGAIFGKKGDFSEAEKCYRQVTELNPHISEAWYYLAMSLVYQGKLTNKSLAYFSKSLELNHRYIPSMIGQACLLRDMGRHKEAITCLMNALDIDPNNADANMYLGNIFKITGDYNRSIEYFDRVLAKQPNHGATLSSKALALYYLGNIDEAVKLIKDVTRTDTIDPLVAQAYVEIMKNEEDISEVTKYVEKALSQTHIMNTQKVELHFSAGKLYDKSGDYDKAFMHIALANKSRSNIFNVEKFSKYIGNIRQYFNNELINNKRLSNTHNICPVFIVGMPRSGSSLVEQILSCHPNVYGGGELTILTDTMKSVCNIDIRSDKFPEYFSNLENDDLIRLSQSYLSLLQNISKDESYVTDKLPANIERIGMIAILFPNAKIIHTKRHPLDTCISCYFQNFGNNHTYVYNLEKLAKVNELYKDLLEYWRELAEINIHEIEYETLVNNPKEAINELLEFCGLEWSDSCLDFHKSDRLTKTASFDQVRTPLYKSSIGRWRNYEAHLGHLIDTIKA